MVLLTIILIYPKLISVRKAPKGLLKKLKKHKRMQKIIQFLKEAKEELKKVNWPNRQQAIKYTLAVIGISIAVAIFLGGLDFLFNQVLKTYIIK